RRQGTPALLHLGAPAPPRSRRRQDLQLSPLWRWPGSLSGARHPFQEDRRESPALPRPAPPGRGRSAPAVTRPVAPRRTTWALPAVLRQPHVARPFAPRRISVRFPRRLSWRATFGD